MMDKKVMEIKSQLDVIAARQAGREIARDLGLGSADQTRLATAISELARNVIQYAEAGTCTLSDQSDQEQIKIHVVVEDHGTGIRNIEEAMLDGFSTGGGLGAGLPGARRLVQNFSVDSNPGHTCVTIEMIRRRR